MENKNEKLTVLKKSPQVINILKKKQKHIKEEIENDRFRR